MNINNKLNEAKNQKRQLHVLLVEDEPIIREVHQNMLNRLNCQVDLAINGAQVLAKVDSGYDVIFMDIGLPDANGIDITATIRQEKSKCVPIIILTSHSQKEVEPQCLNAGADAVFSKPINFEKLKQVLQEYVIKKKEQQKESICECIN